MTDLSFPVTPASPPGRPAPVELVVRQSPLAAICESLSVTLDEVVNERRLKRAVYDLYRVARRIEDEAWLRLRLADVAAKMWIAAHL